MKNLILAAEVDGNVLGAAGVQSIGEDSVGFGRFEIDRRAEVGDSDAVDVLADEQEYQMASGEASAAGDDAQPVIAGHR